MQWAENRAGAGKPPRLRSFRSLIARGPWPADGPILRDADLEKARRATRESGSIDVNSDGKLDILVMRTWCAWSPRPINVTEAEFLAETHRLWSEGAQRRARRTVVRRQRF